MPTNEYLFPHRLTRRDFITTTATALAGLAAAPAALAQKQAAVIIGTGDHRYEVDQNWGTLPPGMKYGLGCGIIVDSKDRIFVTSRSTHPCVAIFDRNGKLLETWSDEFADKVGFTTEQVKETAHCLYWSKEGKNEYIYWTENVAKPKNKDKNADRIGARVYKTDLNGKILFEIGNVKRVTSTSKQFDWTNPTDVAVAPNGDIYVVDGYGSQRVTHFDKNFKHIKTIGTRTEKDKIGKNAPAGTFNTCHGVWIVLNKTKEPEVWIADRHNDRIEIYDLKLKFKRRITEHVRTPCCFYQHGDLIYVPELAGRVSIFDLDGKLVAHLGDGFESDGKTAKKNNDTNPALFAHPHAITVDSKGDFYTVEWIASGRPRKFKRLV
jgi:peptidylamidoglycolate lyase